MQEKKHFSHRKYISQYLLKLPFLRSKDRQGTTERKWPKRRREQTAKDRKNRKSVKDRKWQGI